MGAVNRIETFERLKAVLVAEQGKRDERTGLAWIAAELGAMHAAVNRMRADRGKGSLPEQKIRQAEQSACGHFDYTKKFALYCADLVEGD